MAHLDTQTLETQERAEALDQLVQTLGTHIPADQLKPLSHFVHCFYSMDTRMDLLGGERSDLIGATLSFWQFIQHHDPAQPKIEVINPNYAHHGWRSTHSVIRILHRDMPFLVDSVRMKLNDHGTAIHRVRNGIIQSLRDPAANLMFTKTEKTSVHTEAFIYLEIDRLDNDAALAQLKQQLAAVLADVGRVVADYQPICDQVQSLMASFNAQDSEVKDFLCWLLADNFTFLGFETLCVVTQGRKRQINRPTETLLGLLRPSHQGTLGPLELEPTIDKDLFHVKPMREPLSFSKAGVRSSVHRPAYPDFIAVRTFDDKGRIVGESRIVGLYTSPVYRQSPAHIPYIRRKVKMVTARANLDPQSHHGKDLRQILEIFPRDELFQTSQDQLFETAMAILRIQERRQIKVFIRQDPYGTFCSALVFVPREIYSTRLRVRIEAILCQRLQAIDSEFTTYFSESILARVHFILKLPGKVDYNQAQINEEIISAAATWEDEFCQAVLAAYGESQGNQRVATYSAGFSAGYREAFSPQLAVIDVQHFEAINDTVPLSMGFYQSFDDKAGHIHCKLYHFVEPLPLADQIPIIENLGLRVLGEHPYLIRKQTGDIIWIHDFLLSLGEHRDIDIQKITPVFKEAFEKIWFGQAENDRFNRLVLAAGMHWRQVAVLRAYARYLKQIKVGFSQSYIAETLGNNIAITRLLIELFETRFNPQLAFSKTQRLARQQQIQKAILEALEQVTVLSEDHVIRRMQSVIAATLRTNFYQRDAHGVEKPYIALKLSPPHIDGMPKPVPLYEIFVYSPAVEGVHLRGGKIARGGLRWSDRGEDFRTEVLGLVKAQQVKNALIVPVGAKGGFVPKQLPVNATREVLQAESIACYQTFIRALLDVTDNLVDGSVVHPDQVIRYDDDDFYLVVAADKGTATFSDIANQIADEYHFWLGDAFASGGSVGYDHKKMGITAKGAWVSVQRHFREKAINVQTDTVTAIGIGDMAGDVFGNGLLQSEAIALVAAFNHIHIFIDPDPNPAVSYRERQRLFALPRSSWQDYDTALLSEGGGIFSRQAKSIPISPPMKARFDIRADRLTPNELIQALLRAPVDLLWNGGIGTYVKSTQESHADVGDKANDPVRINGNELRAKVIGEGGNLGLSQLGRVEYALNGGALNTDFIDNAGGVDCSDHEVNIKILLNGRVANGDMTVKQRNALLETMTDAIAQLVLRNNYRQAQAITLAETETRHTLEEYRRFIDHLDNQGKLDRAIEYLPDTEILAERELAGQGLTRPELSVLISYSKADLKAALITSDIIDDPYLRQEMNTAFPKVLIDQFSEDIAQHRLRREITSTQIANRLIDMMGITYVHRIQQTTGASAAEVARAFLVSRDVFYIEKYWQHIEALDNQVPSALQGRMMTVLMKIVCRASRWFIRVKRQDLVTARCVAHYSPRVQSFMACFADYLGPEEQRALADTTAQLISEQVPEELAHLIAGHRYVLNALPVIQASDQTKQPLEKVAQTYFAIGQRLGWHWYSQQLSAFEAANHWQSLATDGMRDELSWQQRKLTIVLLNGANPELSLEQQLNQWMQQHHTPIARWQVILNEIKHTNQPDLALFTVANRELLDIVQATLHSGWNG